VVWLLSSYSYIALRDNDTHIIVNLEDMLYFIQIMDVHNVIEQKANGESLQ